MIQTIHSALAFGVLAFLLLAVINAFMGMSAKREFTRTDKTRSLLALIFSHIQLLVGLALYFTHDKFQQWSILGMQVMKNSDLRLVLVEHPLVNIIAIVCITIGFSKHKKEESSNGKFKKIALFYLLGLLFLVLRIPYKLWLGI